MPDKDTVVHENTNGTCSIIKYLGTELHVDSDCFTCMRKFTSMGSMMRGYRRILNRERATNTLSAVRLSAGSVESLFTSAYVANVASDTYRKGWDIKTANGCNKFNLRCRCKYKQLHHVNSSQFIQRRQYSHLYVQD